MSAQDFCTPLCGEIRALLDMAAPIMRQAREEDPAGNGDALFTLIGRARQYLTDAEGHAHSECVKQHYSGARNGAGR